MIRLDIDIQKECLESLNKLQTLGEAREEAIKTLKHYHRENDYGAPKDLIMAIKILEQPPDKDWEKYSEKLWKLAYERGKHDAVNGSTGDMPNFQSRENATNNAIDAVSREDVIGKDDTLNVDDQVLYRGEKCIVTFITIEKDFCSVMYDDGSTDSCVQIDKVRKTGKSFPQFSELLKQMKGE